MIFNSWVKLYYLFWSLLSLTHEGTLSNVRKKQQDQTNNMNEQIESLNRSKQKLEKEKSESAMEVDELRVNVES